MRSVPGRPRNQAQPVRPGAWPARARLRRLVASGTISHNDGSVIGVDDLPPGGGWGRNWCSGAATAAGGAPSGAAGVRSLAQLPGRFVPGGPGLAAGGPRRTHQGIRRLALSHGRRYRRPPLARDSRNPGRKRPRMVPPARPVLTADRRTTNRRPAAGSTTRTTRVPAQNDPTDCAPARPSSTAAWNPPARPAPTSAPAPSSCPS